MYISYISYVYMYISYISYIYVYIYAGGHFNTHIILHENEINAQKNENACTRGRAPEATPTMMPIIPLAASANSTTRKQPVV